MENLYTAYTKVIDNKTHYFIKKYLTFPEYTDVAPVLESYGMHIDFNKACSIASVNDPKIREQLRREAESTIQHAKVIDLNSANFSSKSASS
jgi:hypothetical protein